MADVDAFGIQGRLDQADHRLAPSCWVLRRQATRLNPCSMACTCAAEAVPVSALLRTWKQRHSLWALL